MNVIVTRIASRSLALAVSLSSTAPAAPLSESSERSSPSVSDGFDFELKVTSGEAEFAPRAQEGNHVGSGEGTVGGRLKGTVRWSLYENSSSHACNMQFVGEVLTQDGVTIPFEGQGLAIVPDEGAPFLWTTSGAFLFQVEDARYAWLDAKLVLWEGQSNLEAMEATLSFQSPRAR